MDERKSMYGGGHAKGIARARILILLAGILTGRTSGAKFEFSTHRMGAFGPDNVSQTSLADFDRDGDLDFASGKRSGAPGEIKMVWWEYRGPDQWVRHDVGGDQKSNASGAALDVDGDGWTDIITGDSWFRNPRNPRLARWPRFALGGTTSTGVEGLGAEEMVLADVDGDGRLDLLSAHKGWAKSLWHRIPADPTRPWEEHAFGHSTNQGLSTGDYDGDGTTDIVNGHVWYANQGGKGLDLSPRPLLPFPSADPAPGDSPLTHSGDIDGDGDPDVVLCSHFGPDVVWAENADGRGGRWTRHDVARGKANLHSIHLADFDFDKDLDIFAGENVGKLWLFENVDGKGRFQEHLLASDAFGHQAQVGDVDADGDLDIVGKPWDGGVHVYARNLWVEKGHPVPVRAILAAPRRAAASLAGARPRGTDALGRRLRIVPADAGTSPWRNRRATLAILPLPEAP